MAAAATLVDDWPGLLESARLEKVLPLVAARLTKEAPAGVPDDILERLAVARRASNHAALQRSGQVLRIVDLLAGAGITALPIKGPALAQDLYGDPGLRSSFDLDFVVRPEDAAAARETLLRNGFEDVGRFSERILRRGPWSENEVCLIGRSGSPVVDLHWRLGVGYSTQGVDTERLLAGARPLSLLGRDVLALSPADQLLVGALHGARHQWTQLELRLATALQVRRLPAEAWPRVCATARECGCLRRLIVGVVHACRPFSVPVPAEVGRLVREDGLAETYLATLRREARQALRQRPAGRFAEKNWAVVPSPFLRALSEDSLIDAFEHLLARGLLPGPEDWDAVDLPPRLEALYWVLRPPRLAGKYAALAVVQAAGRMRSGFRTRS